MNESLKKVFANDPEILNSLNHKEMVTMFQKMIESMSQVTRGNDAYTPIKGKDYFTDEEIQAIRHGILEEVTPIKGTDYFTSEEVGWIISNVREGLKAEVTPVKGVDYVDGIDGYTPIKNKDYFDGIDGKTPTREDLLSLIVPLIPSVTDGKDAVVDEDEIVKKLIKFIKKKKVLDVNDINGMQGFSKDGINYRFEELMHGGGTTTSSIVYSEDLSSQCNGVNKVFTVPANTAFITLTGTDAPFTYRPVVDYTGSGTTTLTLDAGVNAPSSGATLILTYRV